MRALTKLADRFTEAGIDDEIVIMRIDNGEFFSLSGTAAEAWRLIDGRRSRVALLDALASRYSADRDEIADDVDEMLAKLRAVGLLARG